MRPLSLFSRLSCISRFVSNTVNSGIFKTALQGGRKAVVNLEFTVKFVVFFLLLPFAFRKLSYLVTNPLMELRTVPKILVGFLWGALTAALFTYLVSGVQTLFMIFGYMSGAYCAALSYKRDLHTATLLAPANLSSLFTYAALVLAKLFLA